MALEEKEKFGKFLTIIFPYNALLILKLIFAAKTKNNECPGPATSKNEYFS